MSRRHLPLILAGALAACTVGPDYVRPTAPVPEAYKELKGWTLASPSAAVDRGAWWSVFDDPVLDELERQIDVSNQTLRAAEAAYRVAQALVDQSGASRWPTVGAAASATRSGKGTRQASTLAPSVTAGWDADVWGRIRRLVESDKANAEASADDLASARLSAQATLAIDYFSLRARDALRQLLDDATEAYGRSLKITQNQYDAGVAGPADVASARAQYEQTRSQAVATGIQRAQYEHAIAVLLGRPPAEFTLPAAPMTQRVPVNPPGVPSSLLQRRPDIAAAERRMAAANALIGAAEAAFYPSVSLSGSFEFAASALSSLIGASNQIWSLGAAAGQTLFDGGARAAASEQARASYDEAVANYRQTTLTAFAQVEDQLAALRILEEQADVQSAAVASAADAERLLLNQYKAGTVAYTSVVTAQTIALSNEETALNLLQSRLTGVVQLIQALGGGWSAPPAR